MAFGEFMKKIRNIGFVVWGLAMLFIALIGFWPSYFQPTLASTFNSPVSMMHFHVITTFVWLLLLVIQPLLVYLNIIVWHKYVGLFSLLVALGLIYSCMMVQLQFMHHYASLDEHAHAVLVPFFRLVTLLIFTVCIVLATLVKDRSWHKRLIFLGSFAILEAAFARLFLNYFQLLELSGLLGALVHVLVMVIFLTWDRLRLGYFHPVSLWGTIVITLVTFGSAPVANSAWWADVAAQMATWVTSFN